MPQNTDWKTMDLSDFLQLDRQLSAELPQSWQSGEHIALLSVLVHSHILRKENMPASDSFNERNAFRFIKEHKDQPLCTETILSIYGSMLESGKKAEWKTGNVYLEDSKGFYVTLPAEETPAAMEELCTQYAFLNDPKPEDFEEIFRFILRFICIHPFTDGNGRMSALLLQFLLMKAGLTYAVYLPLDLLLNGVYAKRNTAEIRKASGVFYGMKEMEYDSYIPFMKEILAKSYQIMLDTAREITA